MCHTPSQMSKKTRAILMVVGLTLLCILFLCLLLLVFMGILFVR